MKRCHLFACLIVIVAGSTAAHACQIPVFRYALERWRADAYDAYVLHRGRLSDEHEAMVKRLEDASLNLDKPLNVIVHTVDLDDKDDKLAADFLDVFGAPSGDLPQVWLDFPRFVDTDRMAYKGPLTDQTVDRILDSPARREITRRIVDGQSAVWVLIECGDTAKDDAAEATLRKHVEKAQQELKLPTIEDLRKDEFFQAETQVELRLEFSILRIRNDDPAEQVFIDTLFNCEPGLFEYRGKDPMAIPVFGRGRTYYALVGKGIQELTIGESCAFVAGACSCQVKEQNPGADLLMAANWDELIVGSAIPPQPTPELTGLSTEPARRSDGGATEVEQGGDGAREVAMAGRDGGSVAPDAESAVTLPDMTVTGEVTAERAPLMWLVIGGVVLVAILIVAVGTVLMGMRKQET